MLSQVKERKATTGRLVHSGFVRVVLKYGTSSASLITTEQSESISWICDAYSATALPLHQQKGI